MYLRPLREAAAAKRAAALELVKLIIRMERSEQA